MLSFFTKSLQIIRPMQCRVISTSAVCAAARKGFREKARKKKVKVEEKKVGFIPHNLRNKNKLNIKRENKHVDDSWKQTPADNVWIGKYYKWQMYTVQGAIEAHRETHHPSMYNVPNAPLHVHVELNMQGEKKTKFVDDFSRIALIPHKFAHGEERNVLVFAKGQDLISEALNAGAALAGGVELMKDIQNGKLLLADYQYVLAHPNILPDLVNLRGLMRKKFPNPKNGTLGGDIGVMVQKFLNGIQYSGSKDELQQDFGLVKAIVGTLDMDAKHLEENILHLLKDIDGIRPRREGKFITRTLLVSPPSSETLKIDPFLYVPENYEKKGGKQAAAQEDEESDDEDQQQEKAVN